MTPLSILWACMNVRGSTTMDDVHISQRWRAMDDDRMDIGIGTCDVFGVEDISMAYV